MDSLPESHAVARLATIGFIGIGIMGLPMAQNLLKSGAPVVVWNRSPERCAPLQALGASLAATPDALFAAAEVVILMLATADAMDGVLARASPRFAALISGHTLIHTGTTAPAYSQGLAADVAAAGGRYVECPVSGSVAQAQAGQLIGMLAGDPAALTSVRPLLVPMLRDAFECGQVPSASLMKLAVNLHLITTVTGLCEAFHFAQAHALDLRQFADILSAGPMASQVSTNKLRKLIERDDSAEAAIADVLKNNHLIAQAARTAGISSPLLDACLALYTQTQALGLGARDMTAVLQAIAARTTAPPPAPPTAAPPASRRPSAAGPRSRRRGASAAA